jgi:hypothetical protein
MVNKSHELSRNVNGTANTGNTRIAYMQTVYNCSIPEFPPESMPVYPRPSVTIPKVLEEWSRQC